MLDEEQQIHQFHDLASEHFSPPSPNVTPHSVEGDDPLFVTQDSHAHLRRTQI